MPVFKFALRILLLGAIIYLSVWVLSLQQLVYIDLSTAFIIISIACLMSLISYYAFQNFKAKFHDQLLVLIIGLFTLKLFVYLVFAGIVIWSNQGSANVNVTVLLLVYFVFTGLETFVKWKSIETSH
ncbi:MAG: hypothetical protein AAF363_13400 [Bacteroidota bacterium]